MRGKGITILEGKMEREKRREKQKRLKMVVDIKREGYKLKARHIIETSGNNSDVQYLPDGREHEVLNPKYNRVFIKLHVIKR